MKLKLPVASLLLGALLLPVAPAFAFSLGEAAAVAGQLGGAGTAPANANAMAGSAQLLNSLTGELNVTPQQAAGGAGALLGLAQNRLPGGQYAELLGAVPGLGSLAPGGGALGAASQLLGQGGAGAGAGKMQNLQDVGNSFSALGMSSDMVGQFAPVLLNAIGAQGVSPQLLNSLASVWGVAGR